MNTADCAIGRDAARLVLDGLEGFRDDYEEHILHHRCLAGLQLPVPCVALCPAGVDVPGYMALIGEGRCADAVRLIRKDNPFPVACAYICEHPCEARCRRNMIDDAINIRGLKRYAVDHCRRRAPAPLRAAHRQEGGHYRRRPQRPELRLLPGPDGSQGDSIRGAGASWAACCATASPTTASPGSCWTRRSTPSSPLGIEVHTGVTVGTQLWHGGPAEGV